MLFFLKMFFKRPVPPVPRIGHDRYRISTTKVIHSKLHLQKILESFGS